MRMRAKYKLRHLSNAIVGYLKKVQIKQSKFYAISLFYVYELGPSTKILFPMAVFLPRLMVLKVSMHENAREKRVASILENMNLSKQLICTLTSLYHFIVSS